tara:strand:+ start:357 stop:620 length:264 start_codon:yes stop_codon:yes gene_type:complete
LGFFWGVDRDQIVNPIQTLILGAFGFSSRKMGQTLRENLNRLESVRIPYRNRSGVVELVGMDRLLFARVVIGVTILSPITKGSFGLK